MKMHCLWKTIIGTALFFVMSSMAIAKENTADGWYGHISGGAFTPTDTDFSAAVNKSAFGVTVNATITADISSETGHAVFGTIGKKLNNFFSVANNSKYRKCY